MVVADIRKENPPLFEPAELPEKPCLSSSMSVDHASENKKGKQRLSKAERQ